MTRQSPLRTLALALTLIAATAATGTAQSKGSVATFTALAVDPGASPGMTTMTVDVTVTRWSTQAERDAVTTTLMEQPTKLLEVLQKMPPVGRLSSPGGVGGELRYAAEGKSGGTSRIVMLADRPVGFAEAQYQGRTLEYPFTVIEMRVPPSGNGEGTIAVAAKIMVDRVSKDLILENYTIAPVQLRGVKRLK